MTQADLDRVLDTQVTYPGCQCGPEPTLRKFIALYAKAHPQAIPDAQEYADWYAKELALVLVSNPVGGQ